MNPCIVSFFMDNIDKKTVEYQRKVVEKFNVSNVKHYSVKIACPHAIGIDFFWKMNGCGVKTVDGIKDVPVLEHDTILILDLDCIPLSTTAIDYYLKKASEGFLIGNIQRSNHLENNQHVFAAPSAAALSKETFVKLGMPSALENQRSDVLEEYTWAAHNVGVPVEYMMPLRYDAAPVRYDWEKDKSPYWNLADGMPVYGMGTTYGSHHLGDMFWHNFQIREPGQQERFWAKCEEVLNG